MRLLNILDCTILGNIGIDINFQLRSANISDDKLHTYKNRSKYHIRHSLTDWVRVDNDYVY